ncbi:CpsD/CapB family tyrosine-protein kinase [Paludibaculum fermentans]|uniref:CpsD/CapB family tyrosine-protein kinase n=1 Tax=Paludibaculum fermentans TaxID=1473598 RepID=UPI003EB6F4AC
MSSQKPNLNVSEVLEELQRIVGDPPAPEPVELPAAAPADPLAAAPVETITVLPASRIVMFSEPRSPGADRFRLLRMRLRELRGLVKLQTLAITSPLPQDGKSTVALNLATTLAEGGKRTVLLVEADLHRPSLAHSLGVAARPGLSECLESGLNPLAAISRIEPLGWYLLQAGTPEANPTELLQAAPFPGILEQLAPHFDWILFDTPPVAPLTDALSVARYVDATLLVIRASRTPCSAVDDALALLGPKRVAAIVLNAAEGLNKLYDKYSSYYGSK